MKYHELYNTKAATRELGEILGIKEYLIPDYRFERVANQRIQDYALRHKLVTVVELEELEYGYVRKKYLITSPQGYTGVYNNLWSKESKAAVVFRVYQSLVLNL